jgi:F-type H+-transporting ATPase subunit epsilon
MRLRIVTPTRTLVDAEVSELTAPGSAGQIGVLPQHVTFLGELDAGLITYVENGKSSRVVITGGYAEVVDDVVTVLADDAEFAATIDVLSARQDLDRARELLEVPTASEPEIDRLLRDVRIAEIRIASSNSD